MYMDMYPSEIYADGGSDTSQKLVYRGMIHRGNLLEGYDSLREFV
jgi:hypothetical protein